MYFKRAASQWQFHFSEELLDFRCWQVTPSTSHILEPQTSTLIKSTWRQHFACIPIRIAMAVPISNHYPVNKPLYCMRITSQVTQLYGEKVESYQAKFDKRLVFTFWSVSWFLVSLFKITGSFENRLWNWCVGRCSLCSQTSTLCFQFPSDFQHFTWANISLFRNFVPKLSILMRVLVNWV